MRLDDACPRTPEAFERMVDGTLARLAPDDTPARARMPRRRALLIAALIALTLISGMALAAARLGLVDMLFDGGAPSRAASDTVMDIAAADASAGYSLSARQYLIDGDKLYIYYDLGAEADAVACTRVSVSASHALRPVAEDALIALGGGLGAQAQLFECLYFDALPREPFEVKIDAWLMRPLLPLRMRAPDAGEALGLADGAPDASGDALWVNYDRRIYLNTRADYRSALEAGADASSGEGLADVLTQLGLACQPVRLSVSFTVDPATSAGAVRALAAPLTVDFGEYTLTVNRAEINSASALILFTLHPRRAMELMTMYNDDPLWRNYEARLPDGTPLDASTGGGFSTETDADGQVYLDYELRLGGVSQLPDALLLTPYRVAPDGTHTYFEDETVTVPLAGGK